MTKYTKNPLNRTKWQNKNVFILFFWISICTAQNNFTITDNYVQWQKIYETQASAQQIKKQLLQNNNIFHVEEMGNTFIVSVKDMLIDYEGAGRKSGNTSIYVQGCRFSFISTIEIKENKYRITINQIQGTYNFTAGFITEGEVMNLETAALRKQNTEFKPSFIKNDLAPFSYSFEKMFTFKNTTTTDW